MDASDPSAPLVVHVFPTFDVGGAQVRFAALANALGNRWRHRIVSLDGGYGAAGLLGAGVTWERAEVPAPKRATLANVRRFRRLLTAWRPAVLVTCNWGAIEWAMANMLPVCRHIHIEDGFSADEARRQHWRRVLTRRFVLSRASRIVLPSRTLHRLAADVWRLPEHRLLHVPNGIDVDRFAGPPDTALLARLGLERTGEREAVIGTVAALRPEKNLSRLLQALARVVAARAGASPGARVRLVIVGDGPERPRLEAEATALGLAERVTFTGRLARPERILGAFDLFALSSDTEQMPLSVLEAMAAGLPIVSVDVGDVAAMVAVENGPCIVRGGAEALAAAMGSCLEDPARARVVGLANRERVRAEFDQQRMFAAYDRLFREG